MGLPRSTFYDAPPAVLPDDGIVARIGTICDEFECYGYRRVGAALRHQGVVVNGKKLRRLMREHDLQPKQRRRYVVTTDSDQGGPIYADLAKDIVPDRPNQLWVADLTYVAIPGGFVYLAAILDAWSRKIVGYAISRSIDARIAVAALKAAISVKSLATATPFSRPIATPQQLDRASLQGVGRLWVSGLPERPSRVRRRQATYPQRTARAAGGEVSSGS
jgi:putative transposase